MVEEYKVIPVGRAKDLRGQKFGALIVLDRTVKPKSMKRGGAVWLCECECGVKTSVRSDQLTGGITKSCGCLRMLMVSKTGRKNALDLSGQQFGRLTAISKTSEKGANKVKWLCKCECGEISQVISTNLVQGATKSCGCLSNELFSAMRKLQTGENNPNYNPILSDEDRMSFRYQLHGLNLKKWRIKVFERDSYSCRACNSVGGTLNAHHLDGWNWAKEKRFDLDNGVTLCETCHKDFHSHHGYGDNTVEQFNDWSEKVSSADIYMKMGGK